MKDGGPAFPIGSGDMRDPMGMSLRDYFAAAALTGMLADSGRTERFRDTHNMDEINASWAYELADAMLAEREKQS